MSRSSWSKTYTRLKRRASVLHPNVDFQKTEQYSQYKKIISSGKSASKNRFYVFQFNKKQQNQLKKVQNRWAQTPIGQSSGVNGKTILENASPAVRKILRGNGRQFRSMSSFKSYINKANEFIDRVSQGKIKKAEIKRGIERTIDYYSDASNPDALDDAYIKDLENELDRLDHQNDEQAFNEISKYENKEDWYEARKQPLRDISKIRKEVERQAKKRKSINSKTANRYVKAYEKVAGQTAESETWFGVGTTRAGQENKRGFNITKLKNTKNGRIAAQEIWQTRSEIGAEAGKKAREAWKLGSDN